jgi:shikimate kinase
VISYPENPENPVPGRNPGKLALLGFMGCGKSSIGPLLALKLGVSYIDLDERIERREARTIGEIFLTRGEAVFRELEQASLAEVARRSEPCVLSCGGGIVLSELNRRVLRESFVSVWVDVPLEELLKRLENERKTRPLLARGDYPERAFALLGERRALYESASRYRYRWKKGEDAPTSAALIAGMLEG